MPSCATSCLHCREESHAKGHPQERKDEIAPRVTETISEVAKRPKEAIWVVFEDVTSNGVEWAASLDPAVQLTCRPSRSKCPRTRR